MGTTKISWATRTWNPWRGCTPVSTACRSCYAASLTEMQQKNPQLRFVFGKELAVDGRFTGVLAERWDRAWAELNPQQAPSWVFVNSMADTFDERVPWEWSARVFAKAMQCPQHQFLLLTKRPHRARQLLNARDWWREIERQCTTMAVDRDWAVRPLPNVWIGTTVEADHLTGRADVLRDTETAHRWLSLEPLVQDVPSLDLTGIELVVVGGESAQRGGQFPARRMDPGWARRIRDACFVASVPFHFKQTGTVLAKEWGIKASAGQDPEEWPDDLQIREMPDLEPLNEGVL